MRPAKRRAQRAELNLRADLRLPFRSLQILVVHIEQVLRELPSMSLGVDAFVAAVAPELVGELFEDLRAALLCALVVRVDFVDEDVQPLADLSAERAGGLP